MLSEQQLQDANTIVKKLAEEIGNYPPELHSNIFKQFKDFTKDRLSKEAGVRLQEAEAINMFLKDHMQ